MRSRGGGGQNGKGCKRHMGLGRNSMRKLKDIMRKVRKKHWMSEEEDVEFKGLHGKGV